MVGPWSSACTGSELLGLLKRVSFSFGGLWLLAAEPAVARGVGLLFRVAGLRFAAVARSRYLRRMTQPETVPHQTLAEALASIVCATIAARFFRREKPAAGGDVVARELLFSLTDFVQLARLPATRRWFDEHVRSVAAAVIDDIESRGVPHSFVAPT